MKRLSDASNLFISGGAALGVALAAGRSAQFEPK
jgi:hypothetical protein